MGDRAVDGFAGKIDRATVEDPQRTFMTIYNSGYHACDQDQWVGLGEAVSAAFYAYIHTLQGRGHVPWFAVRD